MPAVTRAQSATNVPSEEAVLVEALDEELAPDPPHPQPDPSPVQSRIERDPTPVESRVEPVQSPVEPRVERNLPPVPEHPRATRTPSPHPNVIPRSPARDPEPYADIASALVGMTNFLKSTTSTSKAKSKTDLKDPESFDGRDP